MGWGGAGNEVFLKKRNPFIRARQCHTPTACDPSTHTLTFSGFLVGERVPRKTLATSPPTFRTQPNVQQESKMASVRPCRVLDQTASRGGRPRPHDGHLGPSLNPFGQVRGGSLAHSPVRPSGRKRRKTQGRTQTAGDFGATRVVGGPPRGLRIGLGRGVSSINYIYEIAQPSKGYNIPARPL